MTKAGNMPVSEPGAVKDRIRARAAGLGFSHCGFARAEPLEPLRKFYNGFISERRFAGMDYLERYARERLDPGLLLPGIRSVIALLMNYCPGKVIPEKDNFIISRYAYGKGYQPLVKARLAEMAASLKISFPGTRSLAYGYSGAY